VLHYRLGRKIISIYLAKGKSPLAPAVAPQRTPNPSRITTVNQPRCYVQCQNFKN
jgi:hypothetical protein